MIASAALADGHPDMALKARAHDDGQDAPHVVQIAGWDPYWMGEAARLARDAGADIVDINMGCPNKRVTTRLAGSALMADPDMALRLVDAVVAAVDGPVTLKMRLGWSETGRNAADIARRAETSGVAMIAIHGRTRCQFYSGQADWDAVSAVTDAVSVPVVVNGDIDSVSACRAALAASGAAGVMIGRAAQGQPWVLGQWAAALAGAPPPETPDPEAVARLLCDQVGDVFTLYGVEIGVRVARKHVAWTMDRVWPGLRRSGAGKAILTETDPDRVLEALARLAGTACAHEADMGLAA